MGRVDLPLPYDPRLRLHSRALNDSNEPEPPRLQQLCLKDILDARATPSLLASGVHTLADNGFLEPISILTQWREHDSRIRILVVPIDRHLDHLHTDPL